MKGNSPFSHAYALEVQGKTEEAIHHYAAVGKSDPKHRDALLSMAALYSKLDKTLDSLFCFERAVSIEPDFLSIFNIGNIYYKLSDHKKAVIFFERARAINPDFMPAKLMLGLSFSRMSNFTAAESCFHEVLILAPSNEVALIALSMLKYEHGDFSTSEELTARILLLNPNNNSAKKIRSKALLKLGRLDESRDETSDLTKTDPGFRDYTDYIKALPAETFTDKYGTIDSKIENLEQSARETNDQSKLISLSLCYLLKGDSDSAIKFLFKARETA